MMNSTQKSRVQETYTRFIESEDRGWTELDDQLEFVSWLSDEELITETAIKAVKHSQKGVKCFQDHKIELCMAPVILEAVEAILNLYGDTGTLHDKNRYILLYYLAMSELQIIIPQ